MSQITQRRRIAVLLGKEVLVDAKHPGARSVLNLAEQPAQAVVEPPPDSGTADLLTLAQTRTVDAVTMLICNRTPEWLA